MTEKEIIDSFINSYAEMERHDLRVDKVVLTKTTFRKLLFTPSFREVFSNYPYIPDDPTYRSRNSNNKITGKLFGSDVIIGKENKLFSEPGFVPYSKPWDEMTDLERPVDYLEFNTDNGSFKILNNTSKLKREDIEIDETTQLPMWSVKLKIDNIHLKSQNKLSIFVKSRENFYYRYDKKEWTAIETLREMITEKQFRKYITYGFVTVKSGSGKIYQIFRDKSHTKVWYKGKLIEEVCVRIKDKKIPLTDNIIAFKTIIETDENEFKKMGNVYKMKVA